MDMIVVDERDLLSIGGPWIMLAIDVATQTYLIHQGGGSSIARFNLLKCPCDGVLLLAVGQGRACEENRKLAGRPERSAHAATCFSDPDGALTTSKLGAA